MQWAKYKRKSSKTASYQFHSNLLHTFQLYVFSFAKKYIISTSSDIWKEL